MTQPSGPPPAQQRIPLSADEKARAVGSLSPYVAEALLAEGRYRISAATPDEVEVFQSVARRVGDQLQRPVVSVANGREIVITFAQQDPPVLTGY